jgi:hypothetical protein
MQETIDKNDLPTSFGSFKPVGHVMLGLPDEAALAAAKLTLRAQGWNDEAMTAFTPRESLDEMQGLIDNASPLAGFGSEIALMRRYLDLARQGYRWLLVQAQSSEDAQRVADLAKGQGATLAVYYRALIVEDIY